MAKHLHIHVHKQTKDNWEESKHPRAENGQFGAGGGGKSGRGGSGTTSPAPSGSQHLRTEPSSLKQGQPLYNGQGQKVDQVELVLHHKGGVEVHTQAGYVMHVKPDGSNSKGWSNVKPDGKAPAGAGPDHPEFPRKRWEPIKQGGKVTGHLETFQGSNGRYSTVPGASRRMDLSGKITDPDKN